MVRFDKFVRSGATCDGATFIPNTNLSVWRVEAAPNGGNVFRLYQCPAGYYMVRDELYPEQDNCVQCGISEYLLAPITIENASIKCSKCPVGGLCPGWFSVPSVIWAIFCKNAVSSLWQHFKVYFVLGGNNVIPQADYWRRDERVLTANSSSPQVVARLWRCFPGNCLG